MDTLQEVENALSAALVRANLLGAERPLLAARYRVERVLGHGASGVVVKARDEELQRMVAVKLGLVDADASTLTEARALAALKHPNVVQVYERTVAEATFGEKRFRLPMVCMEHIDGPTLRAWLAQAPRAPREIVRVFVAAGRGLAAAHAKELVHRDFKPDNVLIGADGVPRVIDFGFVLPATSTVWKSDVYAPVAGTYRYMAPEAKEGRVTRRGDQYAFGVSIVEALAGSPRPAVGSSPAGVPARTWQALRRATSARPDDRFPAMEALLDELEASLVTGGASARRRRMLFAMAAAGAVLGVTATAVPPAWTSRATGWLAEVADTVAGFGSSAEREPVEDLEVVAVSGGGTLAVGGAVASRITDAGLGVVDGGATLVDPGVDAATDPSATDPDAGSQVEVACPEVTGTYRLTTRSTWGRALGAATYVLELTRAGPDDLHGDLTKTASGGQLYAQGLTNVEVQRRRDCSVEIAADHPNRSYRFQLVLDEAGGDGTFQSEGDASLGRFGGTVEVEKVHGS